MYQHVNPEEAVAMMPALRAARAVPIHWGTSTIDFFIFLFGPSPRVLVSLRHPTRTVNMV